MLKSPRTANKSPRKSEQANKLSNILRTPIHLPKLDNIKSQIFDDIEIKRFHSEMDDIEYYDTRRETEIARHLSPPINNRNYLSIHSDAMAKLKLHFETKFREKPQVILGIQSTRRHTKRSDEQVPLSELHRELVNDIKSKQIEFSEIDDDKEMVRNLEFWKYDKIYAKEPEHILKHRRNIDRPKLGSTPRNFVKPSVWMMTSQDELSPLSPLSPTVSRKRSSFYRKGEVQDPKNLKIKIPAERWTLDLQRRVQGIKLVSIRDAFRAAARIN